MTEEEEEDVGTDLKNWSDQVLFWCLLPGMCDTNARHRLSEWNFLQFFSIARSITRVVPKTSG